MHRGDFPISLSVTTCATRAPSRNQRTPVLPAYTDLTPGYRQCAVVRRWPTVNAMLPVDRCPSPAMRAAMTLPFARIQTALSRMTADGATELRRRAITPTLAVHCHLNADTTLLANLADRATATGVEIRYTDPTTTDSRGGQLSENRVAQLADVPDWHWQSPGGRVEEGIQIYLGYQVEKALAQFEGLYGHTQVAHSDENPSEPVQDDFRLADWLRRQRLANVASTLRGLAEDDTVHGVLCAPPLPPLLDLRVDLAPLIPPAKDVDGAHPKTLNALLPFANLGKRDVVLSHIATAATTSPPLRALAAGLIVLATVNAAARQHPLALTSPAELDSP